MSNLNNGMKEFKAFILKGNIIDMAVGVIIGGAFSKIVTSLVNDILMPANPRRPHGRGQLQYAQIRAQPGSKGWRRGGKSRSRHTVWQLPSECP